MKSTAIFDLCFVLGVRKRNKYGGKEKKEEDEDAFNDKRNRQSLAKK